MKLAALAVAVFSLQTGSSAAQEARAAAAVETSNYLLRASDQIEVRVYRQEDLTQRTTVNQDGTVRLPLIGVVRVGGQTVEQAQEKVRAAYADGYFVNPQVSVNVLSYAKRKVTVLGQVQSPGAVEIRPGSKLSILEAVGERGGWTRVANPKAVIVKRGNQTMTVNVKELATNASAAPFYLVEGDVVMVKESIF